MSAFIKLNTAKWGRPLMLARDHIVAVIEPEPDHAEGGGSLVLTSTGVAYHVTQKQAEVVSLTGMAVLTSAKD